MELSWANPYVGVESCVGVCVCVSVSVLECVSCLAPLWLPERGLDTWIIAWTWRRPYTLLPPQKTISATSALCEFSCTTCKCTSVCVCVHIRVCLWSAQTIERARKASKESLFVSRVRVSKLLLTSLRIRSADHRSERMCECVSLHVCVYSRGKWL